MGEWGQLTNQSIRTKKKEKKANENGDQRSRMK